MPEPIYASRFPQGRLSQIWDYVITALQEAPELKAAIDHWEVWDGDLDDVQPTPVAQDADRVTLKITSDGGALQWTDERRHGGSWYLRVDLFLPSTSQRWALDAWETIYNAIPFPGDTNVADTNQPLVTLGCHHIVAIGPAVQPQPYAHGMGMLVSGRIELKVNVGPRA